MSTRSITPTASAPAVSGGCEAPLRPFFRATRRRAGNIAPLFDQGGITSSLSDNEMNSHCGSLSDGRQSPVSMLDFDADENGGSPSADCPAVTTRERCSAGRSPRRLAVSRAAPPHLPHTSRRLQPAPLLAPWTREFQQAATCSGSDDRHSPFPMLDPEAVECDGARSELAEGDGM